VLDIELLIDRIHRFLADRTIGRAFGTVCRLSYVCLTFCIVAKRYVSRASSLSHLFSEYVCGEACVFGPPCGEQCAFRRDDDWYQSVH